ncbi:hypothetical protein GCM10022295_67620 [Streptomyces osmaniensis]|uniref:Uncharacterized protein n=1 Tax=Streptomyces osmaniensis TaxID=593134 RepID=A0ABP6Y333_9ACTN
MGRRREPRRLRRHLNGVRRQGPEAGRYGQAERPGGTAYWATELVDYWAARRGSSRPGDPGGSEERKLAGEVGHGIPVQRGLRRTEFRLPP